MTSASGNATLFEFTHPVFRAPEARFVLGSDGKPCMGMKLGAYDALVPLVSIVKEFHLDGTPDGLLLETVIAGLKYVKTIRPGDSIPRELLDGSASWRVDDSHIEVVYGRLHLQIYGYLTGNERVVTNPMDILQLVGDPKIEAKVEGSWGVLAQRLDMATDRHKEVRDRVDKLARELVYIEALRERFDAVRQLQGKIASLRRTYRNDKTVDEELIRVNNLLLRPIGGFEKTFDELDDHSGSIIEALRHLEGQIGFIRLKRDELHVRLMEWDELLAKWQTAPLDKNVATESLIKELYRFLAQNFLSQKSW